MSNEKHSLSKLPDPIWDSKTVGEEYGILGETHQEFENAWIKESKSDMKHGETLNSFRADQYQFNEKEYYHDYDRKLYRKLSGLYSVLGSIQKAGTVVTADMLTEDTYRVCKNSYGISKKELQRLVSDAQQGRVPDFTIQNTNAITRDAGKVNVAQDFRISRDGQRTDEPAMPLTEDQQNVRILRKLEAEAVSKDTDLTSVEIERTLREYDQMSDVAFMSAIRHRYGKNRPPEWDAIIAKHRSQAQLQPQETVKRHHVTVSMFNGLANVSSVRNLQQGAIAKKVMSGQDAQQKAGAQALARLLAEKRAAAGRKLNSWQAVKLSEAEVKDFHKKYGISKKDLEKLSLEIQSGQTKDLIQPAPPDVEQLIAAMKDMAKRAAENVESEFAEINQTGTEEEKRFSAAHRLQVRQLFSGLKGRNASNAAKRAGPITPATLSGQILTAHYGKHDTRQRLFEEDFRAEHELGKLPGSLKLRDFSRLVMPLGQTKPVYLERQDELLTHCRSLAAEEKVRADLRGLAGLMHVLHMKAVNNLNMNPEKKESPEDHLGGGLTLNRVAAYIDALKHIYEMGPGKTVVIPGYKTPGTNEFEEKDTKVSDALTLIRGALRQLRLLGENMGLSKELNDDIDLAELTNGEIKGILRLSDMDAWLDPDHVPAEKTAMERELDLSGSVKADLEAFIRQKDLGTAFAGTEITREWAVEHYAAFYQIHQKSLAVSKRKDSFATSPFFQQLSPEQQKTFLDNHQFFLSVQVQFDRLTQIVNGPAVS